MKSHQLAGSSGGSSACTEDRLQVQDLARDQSLDQVLVLDLVPGFSSESSPGTGLDPGPGPANPAILFEVGPYALLHFARVCSLCYGCMKHKSVC